MADFIPKQEAPLFHWLKELKTELPKYEAELEITPARATNIYRLVDAHLDAITQASDKRGAWLAATSIKKLVARESLAGLRAEIARWKTSAGAGGGALAALKLTAGKPGVDFTQRPPEVTAMNYGGAVRLRLKKRGAHALDIYMRLDGEAKPRLVARVTRSPYLDHTPVRVPGQAETREYQLIPVMNDQPAGLLGSAVCITVPGTIGTG